jgi:hypothetical protein
LIHSLLVATLLPPVKSDNLQSTTMSFCGVSFSR